VAYDLKIWRTLLINGGMRLAFPLEGNDVAGNPGDGTLPARSPSSAISERDPTATPLT
jgi:hypothetical protein